MKRSRFTEEQIIAVLKEQEAGMPTADVCRKHGISSATFYYLWTVLTASSSLMRPNGSSAHIRLNDWEASTSHYKNQVPYVPVRPVIHFAFRLAIRGRYQVAARYSSPCRSKAHNIRAFLLTTATAARL